MWLDVSCQRFGFMIVTLSLIVSTFSCRAQQTPPFRNEQVAMKERIHNLLSLLTLEEKISLLGYEARGVPRLGDERIIGGTKGFMALHGLGRRPFFPRQ